jgi:hypothetical protein
MDVGQLGSFRATRIDHDQGARRIVRDLAQGHAGARNRVRMPGIFPQEQRHFAVLEVGARHGAEHAMADPELAGFLLRERARSIARVERAARSAGICAGQVIALSAAAVIEDRVAAEAIAHRCEAPGHLTDRGAPVDRLERAIGTPSQRRAQAIARVLVVIEPLRLLARVATRRRVPLVAAHAHETAPVLAAELDLEAAVALAQDAGRGLPGAVRHAGRLDKSVS